MSSFSHGLKLRFFNRPKDQVIEMIDVEIRRSDSAMNSVTLMEDGQSLGKITNVFHDGFVTRLEWITDDAGVNVSNQALVINHVECLVSEWIVTWFVPVSIQSYNISMVTESTMKVSLVNLEIVNTLIQTF